MMSLRRVSLLFLLSLFLFSCGKEAVPPTVELLAPRDGFKADVGDTLKLRVRAEAVGKGLERASVALLDEAHRQALPSISFDLKKAVKVEKRFLYPIEQPPEGKGSSFDLRVTVKALNGEENTAFAEGRVNGKPRDFKKAFIVLRPTKDRVKVFEVQDLQDGPQLFKDLQTDYSGSASSSKHSEILLAGAYSGDLRAFDAGSGQELWSVANQGASPYPYFLDLESEQSGEWVLAPTGKERLKGYRGGSGPDLSAEALDDHFIREVALMDERVLSEQEAIGPGKRQWVTYYASTGAIGTQKEIPDMDIVTILPGGPGKAIVLANSNGQGKLYRYDVQGRYFQEIAGPPSGRFLDGIRMDEGQHLLVHTQGLMVFEMADQIFRDLAPAVPQALAYEEVEERIFTAEGKYLRVRDPEQGNVQWQNAFTDSLEDLHLLYGP